ncbi:hypothetical protein G7059_07935 [Erysipelothrix sp. HDW6A]|uniref:hypothetical protein n=1 Tax=Erysipelothrix sp. HDW6A TaxID=2714928 RepID=UPI001409F772|nr:hypothetical protein [Erysipelothrix sp. HDW6A]QIK57773.1 hypothetical protein G7059_07935 [Erysipelothrix sp. HDW6A]
MNKEHKFPLNIQLFAEGNIIKEGDMGKAKDIDFVERFSASLVKLTEALGITRPLPMKQGNKIQTYKFVVTPAAGDAAKGIVREGEDIPLTHVKRELDREIEVGFRKYRKAVTMEEVQRIGYDAAVNKSDKQVLGLMQKNVRTDFFDYLATAPTKMKAKGLQAAFGKAWGKLNALFEDYGEFQIVQFINPEDAGEYLGEEAIANGTSVGFGLTLLKDFTGAGIVLINASVPRGKVYATAVDNINLMYIDVNGEARKVFEGKTVVSDELGLIGLVKEANTINATTSSTLFNGVTLFAEITNGVIEVTVEKPVPEPAGE